MLEMVEAQLVPSRRHAKLPPTSKIQYPFNLQIYHSKNKRVTSKGTLDEEALVEDKGVEPEDHENFLKEFATHRIDTKQARPSGSECVSSLNESKSSLSDDGKPQAKVCRKSHLAVQAMRVQHGIWDRTKRELEATILMSNANTNTKGSPMELSLGKVVEDGRKTDAKLVELECEFLQGNEKPISPQ